MGGGGSKRTIHDTVFDLKIRAKELEMKAKRKEAEEKKEEQKAIACIQKGDKYGARCAAENAERCVNQRQQFLQLSAKFNGLASKVESGVENLELQKAMASVSSSLQTSLTALNDPETMKQVANFQKVLEDMDVQVVKTSNEVGAATQGTMDEEAADRRLAKLADEHNLNVGGMLSDPSAVKPQAQGQAQAAPKQDDLEARLAGL